MSPVPEHWHYFPVRCPPETSTIDSEALSMPRQPDGAAAYNKPSLDITTDSDTFVARMPFRPARFSHDSNILRKYGTEGAGRLRYSPLKNARTGVSHGAEYAPSPCWTKAGGRLRQRANTERRSG